MRSIFSTSHRAGIGLCILLGAGVVMAAPASSKPADSIAQARLHFELGNVYLKAGRYDDAIKEFLDANKLYSNPAFFYNIAEAHRYAGRKKEARLYYQGYVRAEPAGARSDKARVLIESLGRELEEEARQAAQDHLERARAAVKARELDKAVAAYRAAQAVHHDPEVNLEIAQALRKKGDRPSAIYACRAYVTEAPVGPRSDEARTMIAALEKEIRDEAAARTKATDPAIVAAAEPKGGEGKAPASKVLSPTTATAPPSPPEISTPSAGAGAASVPTPALLSAEPEAAQPQAKDSPRPDRFLAPALVGVLALAAAGTSLGLYLSIDGKYNSLEGRCAPNCATGDVDDLRSRATALYVIGAVGAVAAVGDVVLWVLAARRRTPERRVQVLPAIGGLVIRGGF